MRIPSDTKGLFSFIDKINHEKEDKHMTLHLTATTTEEKVLKEYLEQNASEVLAD